MLPLVNQTGTGPINVVIMGCGRIGASIAATLAEAGHAIHILDPNVVAFDLLPQGMVGDGRIVPIVGDGTRESDLRKTNTRDAEIFIAVTGKDTRNALGAQLAKHILQVPIVICRMNDPTRTEMYNQLDLSAISATKPVTDMVLKATVG